LRAVAYRMLGSQSEAEDAVQEAWLRLRRADTSTVENLGGWLTSIVAPVCLNMLQSRKSRREDPVGAELPDPVASGEAAGGPGQEAVMADSVGLALPVALDTLTPAERLAFVFHDMFAVPFDEIAPIVHRSPAAARQLASRARRHVRGSAAVPDADPVHQREVVNAFLAASRGGDFDALLTLLDPEVVVLRADQAAVRAAPRRRRAGPEPWPKPSSGAPGPHDWPLSREPPRRFGLPASALGSSSGSPSRTGRSWPSIWSPTHSLGRLALAILDDQAG
jgi:RNA polymerase sigma-70 factor, ECF subfamily